MLTDSCFGKVALNTTQTAFLPTYLNVKTNAVDLMCVIFIPSQILLISRGTDLLKALDLSTDLHQLSEEFKASERNAIKQPTAAESSRRRII